MMQLPALETLGRPHILVVGDVMLDEYVWGEVSRISPEAPVPVVRGTHREFKVGGAGSVVENLAVLGASVDAVGLVGEDEAGRQLRSLFAKRGIEDRGLVVSATRRTTCKTRVMAYVQHANRAQQQILRLDWEEVRTPSAPEAAQLREALEWAFARKPQLVLVSDYEKGLLTDALLQDVIQRGRLAGIRVLIDPGRTVDYDRYRGAWLICPNRFEAQQASGVPMREVDDYGRAGRLLVERLGLEHAALTLDREGIMRVSADGSSRLFPTRVRTVTDVAGAGDMVHSIVGLAIASGWGIDDALLLANVGAGVEVSKVGVTPIERWELYQACAEETSVSKVRRYEDLLTIVERAHAAGTRIVFTNGCFDFLHAGHVKLLQQAREFGDLLIVGLNSDDSVRRLKGPNRPVMCASDRGSVLSGLASVDHVVFFDADTPLELIERIRPQVLVKGADYAGGTVVGREIVEAAGGRVELIPLTPNLSSTAILGRLRADLAADSSSTK